MTSLDIVAWAYLKEELTNTSDAKEVKYLNEHFPNLVKFTGFIDGYFESLRSGSTKMNTSEGVFWNQEPDFTQKIVNSL